MGKIALLVPCEEMLYQAHNILQGIIIATEPHDRGYCRKTSVGDQRAAYPEACPPDW